MSTKADLKGRWWCPVINKWFFIAVDSLLLRKCSRLASYLIISLHYQSLFHFLTTHTTLLSCVRACVAKMIWNKSDLVTASIFIISFILDDAQPLLQFPNSPSKQASVCLHMSLSRHCYYSNQLYFTPYPTYEMRIMHFCFVVHLFTVMFELSNRNVNNAQKVLLGTIPKHFWFYGIRKGSTRSMWLTQKGTCKFPKLISSWLELNSMFILVCDVCICIR